MYEVAARVPYWDTETVGCFDPTRVVVGLLEAFPEAIVCVHDYGWQDYDTFMQRAPYSGAVRVAERDGRERAPIFRFRLRTGTAQIIHGVAERYVVRVNSDDPIPEPLKARLLAFFGTLRFDPIKVESVRIDGNDVEPW